MKGFVENFWRANGGIPRIFPEENPEIICEWNPGVVYLNISWGIAGRCPGGIHGGFVRRIPVRY